MIPSNHIFSRDYSTWTINTDIYTQHNPSDTELSQYAKSVNQTKYKSADNLFAESFFIA